MPLRTKDHRKAYNELIDMIEDSNYTVRAQEFETFDGDTFELWVEIEPPVEEYETTPGLSTSQSQN